MQLVAIQRWLPTGQYGNKEPVLTSACLFCYNIKHPGNEDGSAITYAFLLHKYPALPSVNFLRGLEHKQIHQKSVKLTGKLVLDVGRFLAYAQGHADCHIRIGKEFSRSSDWQGPQRFSTFL